MKYFEWESAVTAAVAGLMAISHSDAAGIVEAQPFYMQQSWGKGMDAQLTAAKVIEAAQEQAEERAVTPAPNQERMLFGDEADAHAFWKDKEFKVFAVDLVQGNGKKRKVIRTMYVRARTAREQLNARRKMTGLPGPNPITPPGLLAHVNWAVRPPKFEGVAHGNAKTDGRWAAAQLESDPAQA